MMTRTLFTFAAATAALVVAGCDSPFSSTQSTATMFLAETTRDQCDNVTTPPNDGVEIGNLVYTLYPDSGLVCARDDANSLVAAYLPESNATATHRWITESGAGIWGQKHSFGPHDPAQFQQ